MDNYNSLIKVMNLAQKYYPKNKLKHAIRVAGFACADAQTRTNVDSLSAFIVGIAHGAIWNVPTIIEADKNVNR